MKKAKPTDLGKDDLIDVLESHGIHAGRLIASSKGAYCRKFPKHLVVFNSKICSRDGIIVSGADLDLDRDGVQITAAAQQAGKNFYILPEHKPHMFYSGPISFKSICRSAVWWTQIHYKDKDAFQPISSRPHSMKGVPLVCTVGKWRSKPFYSVTCWDNPLLDSDHVVGAAVELFGVPPAHFEQEKAPTGGQCPISPSPSPGRPVRPVFHHSSGTLKLTWFNHLQAIPTLLYDQCLSGFGPIKYTSHQKVQAIHVWHDKRLLGIVWPSSFVPNQVVVSARAEMCRLRSL
jgi:hypothetical protein